MVWPGVLFPPPWWGGSGNFGIISPPESETLGGKFEIFPPQNPRPWGGNFTISPPRWGGRARRRRKILRILTPEMLEILKKNAFPNVKMTRKPQKFPACGGLFPPASGSFFYKHTSKIPKIFRLRRANVSYDLPLYSAPQARKKIWFCSIRK